MKQPFDSILIIGYQSVNDKEKLESLIAKQFGEDVIRLVGDG